MLQARATETIIVSALIIMAVASTAYVLRQCRRQDRKIAEVHNDVRSVRRDSAERYDALAAMYQPDSAIPAMRNGARTHLRVAKHRER